MIKELLKSIPLNKTELLSTNITLAIIIIITIFQISVSGIGTNTLNSKSCVGDTPSSRRNGLITSSLIASVILCVLLIGDLLLILITSSSFLVARPTLLAVLVIISIILNMLSTTTTLDIFEKNECVNATDSNKNFLYINMFLVQFIPLCFALYSVINNKCTTTSSTAGVLTSGESVYL